MSGKFHERETPCPVCGRLLLERVYYDFGMVCESEALCLRCGYYEDYAYGCTGFWLRSTSLPQVAWSYSTPFSERRRQEWILNCWLGVYRLRWRFRCWRLSLQLG